MTKILLLIAVARRSLFVHKLRSFLSVLGVVCGVMAVMSMISTGEGAKEEVLQQIEDFGDGSDSANDCFKPVSRYFDRIMRPEQLLTALPRAMAVMTDPADCGPTWMIAWPVGASMTMMCPVCTPAACRL